ncbi:lytic murein transglycosylase B [Sulfuriflexus mobilis]|uniref:lytic murein transglycosylase B n=1 Tax=Sulfuriflexus mobilis TaxID=1811807 RepID=UPI001558A7AC|nr:lytic murein transglycosylase B [Sulfuriflexus mobilis]
MSLHQKIIFSLALFGLLSPPMQAAAITERSEVQAFIKEMRDRHDFAEQDLQRWFADTRIKPSIIKAISRPAEKKAWKDYRPIFLTESRIEGGIEFWDRHAELLQRAEQEYGVDPAVIVAIIGVETRYGRHKGSFRVIDALSTLAFDYPPRSKFFRSELEHYLLMTREEKVDPMSLLGSYAGAMGQPQFISSSYRHYAVDFNADGRRDIWNDAADAIGSVANYFKMHGWKSGEHVTQRVDVSAVTNKALLSEDDLKPSHALSELRQQGIGDILVTLDDQQQAAMINLEGDEGLEHWLGLDNFYTITRYNHSALYAMAVYQLSEAIRARRDEMKQADSHG